MLRFLQRKSKKGVIIEYILRILNVFFTFTAITALLLIILFLPSLFFAKFKNNTVSQQLESVKNSYANKNNDSILMIKKVNRMAAFFDSKNDDSLITTTIIIKKIQSLKNNDIQIMSFSFSKNAEGGTEINLSGMSNSRDGLTDFEKKLKTDGLFSNVELPISSFIKNSNTEFNIKLTINKTE